jgi:hypothetical protein
LPTCKNFRQISHEQFYISLFIHQKYTVAILLHYNNDQQNLSQPTLEIDNCVGIFPGIFRQMFTGIFLKINLERQPCTHRKAQSGGYQRIGDVAPPKKSQGRQRWGPPPQKKKNINYGLFFGGGELVDFLGEFQ